MLPQLSMANLDLVHRLIQCILSYYISTNQQNKGGPENPKAKRQQTNLSNTDNWFISFSPLASFFLEDEHYGRIHCKFHFSPPAR